MRYGIKLLRSRNSFQTLQEKNVWVGWGNWPQDDVDRYSDFNTDNINYAHLCLNEIQTKNVHAQYQVEEYP